MLSIFLTLKKIHLDFECEILLHVLDNHHQVWQLDPQGLLGVCKRFNENRIGGKYLFGPPAGQVM